MRSWKIWFGAGLAWGCLEATWFFVVPDVLISFSALCGWRCCLAALGGALAGSFLGASTLYFTTTFDWIGIWSHLPGYGPLMLAEAHDHLQAGAVGMLKGPGAGIPFRIYVLLSRELGLPLGDVFLFIPLARLPRFLLAALLAGAFHQVIGKAFRDMKIEWSSQRLCFGIWVGIWICIYCVYWLSFVPHHYRVE